jgi:glycosyltransferase involved in cell wall biosynthesis
MSGVLLFVGRLSTEKGVDLLVDAWSQLAPNNLELILVGDGPLRASLEARAIPGVRFMGQVAPRVVTELMRTARCLVVPSQWHDVQPIVVIEAMAAGLPAMVSSSGGLPEAVDNDPTFLVPLDAGVEGWSTALTRLSDSIVDEAGRRARARYLARHTPRAALASLIETYDQARAESPHRRS